MAHPQREADCPSRPPVKTPRSIESGEGGDKAPRTEGKFTGGTTRAGQKCRRRLIGVVLLSTRRPLTSILVFVAKTFTLGSLSPYLSELLSKFSQDGNYYQSYC